MEINCYRDAPIASESRLLSAATYNLAVKLLARSPTGNVFVPIRTMQYLAIIDPEEFVFIDGERKCWVDVAWRNFHPQTRVSLDDPVAYEAVYYRPDSAELMRRLLAEFPLALNNLRDKDTLAGPARVLSFPTPGKQR